MSTKTRAFLVSQLIDELQKVIPFPIEDALLGEGEIILRLRIENVATDTPFWGALKEQTAPGIQIILPEIEDNG